MRSNLFSHSSALISYEDMRRRWNLKGTDVETLIAVAGQVSNEIAWRLGLQPVNLEIEIDKALECAGSMLDIVEWALRHGEARS